MKTEGHPFYRQVFHHLTLPYGKHRKDMIHKHSSTPKTKARSAGTDLHCFRVCPTAEALSRAVTSPKPRQKPPRISDDVRLPLDTLDLRHFTARAGGVNIEELPKQHSSSHQHTLV